VTDLNGKLYEHLEYFPFGESWVEENSNTQRTPYLFSAKELDEETGLYYFGARYYDARTSVWQSPDRILQQYLDGHPDGGVYNTPHLGLYSYARQNPLRYNDPDGNTPLDALITLVPAAGKSFGALAAYAVGVATDNQTLQQVALEGMGEMQGENVEALVSVINPIPGGALAMKARRLETAASEAKATVQSLKKVEGSVAGKQLTKGPKPNEGIAKKHGGDPHNDAIDKKIGDLKKDPDVKNIRKNQQQVDVEGNKVGTNKPDVQYDKGGCHHCVEYDTVPKNSTRHGEVIRGNDPKANVDLNVL
jgi:RHS repeat-associated protein